MVLRISVANKDHFEKRLSKSVTVKMSAVSYLKMFLNHRVLHW